jgi:hypothetical protein
MADANGVPTADLVEVAAPAETSVSPAAAPADGTVLAAFRLGWHVSERYALDVGDADAPEPDPAPADATLPSASELGGPDRLRLLTTAIANDLALLADAAGPLPPLAAAAGQPQAYAFHKLLVEALTAADYRLGKAYSLGVRLADVTKRSADAQELRDAFAATRLEETVGWLEDLRSQFPRYAAHAVKETLLDWAAWVDVPGDRPVDAHVLARLREQGRLWRALLSGEKDACHLLRPDDYVVAARGLGHRLGHLVRRTIWSAWGVGAALVVGVIVGGGYVIVHNAHHGSKAALAITTIVGGVGISWKGISATLGKSITRVERPIWEAELGESIAAAARRLPG